VAYERDPIGDPGWTEQSAIRDLYLATFCGDGRSAGSRGLEKTQPTEFMQKKLRGHFNARKDEDDMPCYCVLRLAESEVDRENQGKLLSALAIPDLLFVGLQPHSDTTEREGYIAECLTSLTGSVKKGPT
jgi:hypothetical protein